MQKILVFVVCVEAIIYLLLYNLHDCAFNNHLQKHFSETIKFVKSSYVSHRRIFKYLLSANDELASHCVNSSMLGEGIPKAIRIKKWLCQTSDEIRIDNNN